MDIFILLISLIFLILIFVCVLFFPMWGIGILIIIRPSIGTLRDFAWNLLGIKINILGIFGVFVLLLGFIYIFLKRAWPNNKFFILYIATTIWACITISYAPDKGEAILVFLRFVAPIMFFIVILFETKSNERIYFILKMTALSAIVPIAYGFYQFLSGTGFQRIGIMRINSLFVLPNPYAFYLALIVIICIQLAYINKKLFHKFFYWMLSVAAIISMILTGTRTALISLIIGSTVYAVMNKRWALVFWTYLLLSVMLISMPEVRERIQQPVNLFISKDGINLKKGFGTKLPTYKQNTFQGRIALWKIAIDSFKDRPLIGHGIGSIRSIIGNECHNDYIRLLVELGIVGFMLYVLCFCALLINRFRAWQRSNDPAVREILSGTVSLIIIYMVTMLGDNTITANTYLWYLFSMVAISYNCTEAIDN